MSQKQYWKGLEELEGSSDFLQTKQNEFPSELPVLSELTHLATEKQASRRDFLKVLGFSLGAATIAASCEIPVRKAIPYVMKPEEVAPTIANYYASSFVNGGDYCSVLVKTREGRPINIEGNKLSTFTKGATSSRVLASVLSLYDGERLKSPKKEGKKISWEQADKEIKAQLKAVKGDLVFLTSPIASPSTRQLIEEFKGKYSNTKHVTYQALSYTGLLAANEKSLGEKIIPSYDFSKADVIVGLNADFLATWLSPIEFANQYAQNRRIDADHPTMSKHWQFESYMSLTGANADQRLSVKPSEIGLVAAALYKELKGGGVADSFKDEKVKKALKKAALELKTAKGKALVVCGSNDPNIQMLVNALNQELGAYGTIIDTEKPYNLAQGDDMAFDQLLADMEGGKVGGILLAGDANPAYNYADADRFKNALKKVKLTVSFNTTADETSEGITYLCPDSHYLESWNDAEPKKGTFSLAQPTIAPLFDTRQMGDTLLNWLDDDRNYYDYIQEYWKSNLFGEQSKFPVFKAFWDAALHDGVFSPENADQLGGSVLAAMYADGGKKSETFDEKKTSSSPKLAAKKLAPKRPLPDVNKATVDTASITIAGVATDTLNQAVQDTTLTENVKAVVAPTKPTKSAVNVNVSSASQVVSELITKAENATQGGLELTLFESITMGDGRYANNPFLQETPDPITKVCWDNVVMVSKKYANEQGWDKFDVLEVKVGEKAISLPLVIQPGQPYGTFAIALGYGRTKGVNKKCTVGQNAFPLLKLENGIVSNNISGAISVKKVGSNYELAQTQMHHTIDDTNVGKGKRTIINETTLGELKSDPWAGNHYTKHFKDHADKHQFTLYGTDPDYGPHADALKQGHHWGLAVDMNTCIGCNACVVACNVENNVPVVGQNEVFRGHEMHWMRIDRYYSGEGADVEADDYFEHPDVAFMPMMCQHCDNAPCENVCPVAATNHSSEGLNQMAYNRCIGTRYCANNCPFKVRRFNWFDYQSADSFYKDTVFDNDSKAMMDDLTRMVLNPDVTVRSRGVMEKCSFCVQRIQESKLEAKKDGRRLGDGEVLTACQQGCPTNAIVFGDMNDPNSAIVKAKADKRAYSLLQEIHVMSSVSYLTKVRNREAVAGHDGHGHGGGHDKHDDHNHDDGHGHEGHGHS